MIWQIFEICKNDYNKVYIHLSNSQGDQIDQNLVQVVANQDKIKIKQDLVSAEFHPNLI